MDEEEQQMISDYELQTRKRASKGLETTINKLKEIEFTDEMKERLLSNRVFPVASHNATAELYLDDPPADPSFLIQYHKWLLIYVMTGESGGVRFPDDEE